MTAYQVSDLFMVDSNPPSIVLESSETETGRHLVRLVVRDEEDRVAALEFAVDGAEWVRLDPLDGVADSGLEKYRLILPRDSGGPESVELMVRGTDRSGNVRLEMFRVGKD